MRKFIFNLIVLLAITLSVSSAFAWGDKKEKIRFKSKDVHTYGDILNGIQNFKDVEIKGILTIPKNSEDKIPCMVYMHGSDGLNEWSKRSYYPWLKMFHDMGIATFIFHSFKPRGVESTVGNQWAVTPADMVVDVYMALNRLAKHPRIDPSRIGLFGRSKGGAVTRASYWKPFQEALGNGNQFALHVSIYGGCEDFENFVFTGAPFLALVGEKDNWTPAAPWIDFVKKLKDHGYDAELVVYPGAHHLFDATYNVKNAKEGDSYLNCRYIVKNDGTSIETTSGLNADTEEGCSKCVIKGNVKIGRNSNAKKQSKLKTKEFVTRVFKLNENKAQIEKAKSKKVASTSGYNSTER
jgi:dienelactone hydrolase